MPWWKIFFQFLSILPFQLAFFLGLGLFPTDVMLRLGLFLNGCCPGGGGSNMYTLLLGGSLDLSIMMTFCSSLLAFGKSFQMFHKKNILKTLI